MNASAISGMVVFGRFRIPFPDTTYTARERRDGIAVAGDTRNVDRGLVTATAPCADRRSLRCFVTAHVVASIENLCASELGAHIDAGAESIVGAEVLLKHNNPAAVGSMVSVTGRVAKIEDRSITFNVEANVDNVVIADGELRFVIVERDRFAARRVESIVERALTGILGSAASAPIPGASFQSRAQTDPPSLAQTLQQSAACVRHVSTMTAF